MRWERMSTVDERIRNIRRKILRAIATLPNHILKNVTPETVGYGQFLNKLMINVPDLTFEIKIVDSQGFERVPSEVSLWEPTSPDYKKALAYINSMLIDAPLRVVAVLDGNEEEIELQPQGIKQLIIEAFPEDVLYSAFPPEYPPKTDPYRLRNVGAMWKYTEENYEVLFLVGTVGYETEDGLFVYYRGAAIKLHRLTDVYNEIIVRTPQGRIVCSAGESPAYVVSTVFTLYAKLAFIG